MRRRGTNAIRETLRDEPIKSRVADPVKEPYNNKDPALWTGVRRARFRLTAPIFHHHAIKVLSYDKIIAESIAKAVERMSEAACYVRGRTNFARGIEPKHLNLHFRSALKGADKQWTFETTIEDDVFYDHDVHEGAVIGGFDISRYDVEQNLVRLRNLCFGRRPLKNGKSHWENTLAARPHWAAAARRVDWTKYPIGEDHERPSSIPLVLGEIQFGNWAMAYRDYLKVLAAHRFREIDLFTYIVPTGALQSMLSDGIVTFDNAARFLKSVASAVNVPVVMWGLDIEVGKWKRPLDAQIIRDIKTRVSKRDQEPPP